MNSPGRRRKSRAASRDESIPAQPNSETLPHVYFAEADRLLSKAASLRCKAESLRKRINQVEAVVGELEKSAAKLQATAQEDREHVQAELDTILEYHDDVLNDFLASPVHKKAVDDLTISVEEGRAHVHEVVGLGERILAFRARKAEVEPEAEQPGDENFDGLEIHDEDHQDLERTVRPSLPFVEAPLLDNESHDEEYESAASNSQRQPKKAEKRSRRGKRKQKSEIEHIDFTDFTWVHVAPQPSAQEQNSSLMGTGKFAELADTETIKSNSKKRKSKESRSTSSIDSKRLKVYNPPQTQQEGDSKTEYMKRIIKAGWNERKARAKERENRKGAQLSQSPETP